ncbi:MAG: cytochrome o ubiquinol oxidase subunit III [Rhodospirillales bacterium]
MSDRAAAPDSREREEAENLEQREFGFWLYLMSDAILFALLFAPYAVMTEGTAGGPSGQDVCDLGHVFVETMVLLCSSLTFGFAWLAAKEGQVSKVLTWLAVTFVLGLGFIGLELSEFAGMIAIGADPGRSGFLSAFFTLVGTHGLHVSFGLIFILVMAAQIATRGLNPFVLSRLFRLGLFWHFLDIVWIGIFSVVYLPGLL